MAKIAVDLKTALEQRAITGSPGKASVRLLAEGDAWKVEDVVCTSGPQDRPFEEFHTGYTIAIVGAGTFQYRASLAQKRGHELLTPGSLVLGNADQYFECGHDHSTGDRCISFWYAPSYFERLAADAGIHRFTSGFPALRLPPLRALSPLIARCCSSLTGSGDDHHGTSWEELSVKLAARTIQLASGLPEESTSAPPATIAKVTRAVRIIEERPNEELTLASLAREARLSEYHFLRTFERLTGVTPHRYILRSRLREAAVRLASEPERVLDIAFDCGFGDVSNFNRAFRAEFLVSPRGFRKHTLEALTALGNTNG